MWILQSFQEQLFCITPANGYLLALLMEVTLSMGLPFIWCFFQYTLRHSLFKIYKTKAFDDSY